jgi:23S rRNA pseudouridine2604 synthase
MEPKRLNKFISDAGFCSRREADQLIAHERVTVNGKQPLPGTKVSATDKVRIDGQILHVREEAPVFLVFNKPPGIATTTDRSVRNNIISALNYPATLQPIGFLDRESEGLLFLSNDTELAHKMTKADNLYEKEYVVMVDRMITPEFLIKISENVSLTPGAPRNKSSVTKEGTHRFRIVLEPGIYHNIKKRCEDLGYKVVHLQRVRIAGITPAKLSVGMWRNLTEAEIESIKSIVAGRSRRVINAARDDDEYYGEAPAARRPTPAGRTQASRPARPAAAGRPGASKATGIRNGKSRVAGTGSGPKRGTGAPRTGAPKGNAKGGAGRNAAPKGRHR